MNDNTPMTTPTERETKIKDMIDAMLKPSDFVFVTNDYLEEHDLPEGSELLVAATQVIPCDEDDIYNLRMHIVVHPVRDGHVDTSLMILVDPKGLKSVNAKRQEHLTDMFVLDFQTEEENDDTEVHTD